MSDPDKEPKYDLEEGSIHTAPEPVSDTEVSFFTVVKILLVCGILLYIITSFYEHSVVHNPFGAGTGNTPRSLEGGSQSGDGGIKTLPW